MTSSILSGGEFLGRTQRIGKAERVEVSISQYDSGDRLPEHGHTRPYLSFALRGSYVEQTGSRIYACQEHVLLFHSAGEVHRDEFGPRGGACLNMELAGCWRLILEERPINLAHPVNLGLVPIFPILCESSSADSYSSLALEECVVGLLDLFRDGCRERNTIQSSRPIRRAVEFLEDAGHQDFNLPALAEVAGVHPTHLSRLFRTKLHRTITEYLRELRLVKAEQLLLQPDRSISRIAADLGFADHAHFSRAFKQRYGLTPTTFKVQAKRSLSRALT